MSSPLLGLPGAVAGEGIDAPVAAHYGSFNGEQRTLANGDGFVVSSLHSRAVTRVYAKAITKGKSEAALSEEEAEALKKALASGTGSARG